jgi:hypothetical protein
MEPPTPAVLYPHCRLVTYSRKSLQRCYSGVVQLNKKDLTLYRGKVVNPIASIEPHVQLSAMGHIWKRVWGRKARLAWGSVLLTQRRIYPVIFISMALIKCSECSKEVSDKAAACPFCGNPIGGSPVTIQKTNKKWKVIAIIAFVILFVGIISIFSNVGLGVTLIFVGIAMGIYAETGAWWTNG